MPLGNRQKGVPKVTIEELTTENGSAAGQGGAVPFALRGMHTPLDEEDTFGAHHSHACGSKSASMAS